MSIYNGDPGSVRGNVFMHIVSSLEIDGARGQKESKKQPTTAMIVGDLQPQKLGMTELHGCMMWHARLKGKDQSQDSRVSFRLGKTLRRKRRHAQRVL